MKKFGIDISKHQGDINLSALKDKVGFIIISHDKCYCRTSFVRSKFILALKFQFFNKTVFCDFFCKVIFEQKFFHCNKSFYLL